MGKFSLTISGIIVMIGGTFLVEWGFSESCATEMTNKIPLILGGIMAWYGRFKAGGITLMGIKK